MPIAVVPNINFPSVTVSTPYPGADPETVEAAVTTPIENVLQKQFNNLAGVSSTTIQSGLTREVHVLVNEGALRGRGLSVTDVVTAVQNGQFQTPAGTIYQGDRSYSVYFDALAHQAQDLRNLV